jgi:hypothetical protein
VRANLPKILIKKKDKFIMNSGNIDVSIDGVPVKGLVGFELAIKAGPPGQTSLAETTLKMVGYVEFEQATDEEIAESQAKAATAAATAKALADAAAAQSALPPAGLALDIPAFSDTAPEAT